MRIQPLCLLTSSWLPFLRARSGRAWAPPSALTDGVDGDDPIIALDCPRPDLNAAAHEFLIGLLATTCTAQVRDNWPAWWREPPAPTTLAERFARVGDAFLLDGPGPRFMQDREELAGETVPVSGLLIDSPGANTLRKNADLFVRRGRVEVVSRKTAAMALYTLQTFAPSGGAGHRTSLRGGGPLTTLLLPGAWREDGIVPLWHRLWANVCSGPDWDGDPLAAPERVFPWLVPTRVSDRNVATTPEDVHPAQAFFGMPRRIRLLFEANPDGIPCDLTGEVDAVIVRSYRTRNYGTNYAGWGGRHPLTPYYRQKATDPEWLPRHPQPGRLGYREWLALVLADDRRESKARYAPAAALKEARKRLLGLFAERPEVRFGARLWAAGYDMDNMKARGFVESEMPLVIVREDRREAHAYDDHATVARQLVHGAREAAGMMAYAVSEALALGSSTDGQAAVARDRFWTETETGFFDAIHGLAERLEGLEDPADDAVFNQALGDTRQAWHRKLRRAALRIFEASVPMQAIEERAVERLVKARTNLGSGLNGFGKSGTALYEALGLPKVETARKGKKR